MSTTAGVAITGIGIVAPGGAIGAAKFAEVLREERSLVLPIERFDTASYRAKNAALITDFRPRDFIAAGKLRRMNTLSRFGVAATKLALDDAQWASRSYGRGETGVAIGTAFGPVQTSVEYMSEYVASGPALASPQLFAESVANAPGSHVAIENGFEGFNITFTQREASALTAMTYAASQIVKGTVSAAIAGGVEEVNEWIFHVLDRIGALAHAREGRGEAMRPFDRHRNGLSLGEGGASFVLERHAVAPPYAFLRGYAVGRDTTAAVSDWGSDAEAVANVMRRAIVDAEIAPGDVGAIWASANGSIAGDRVEYRAIQSLFGERVPPVVAAKPVTGEYAAGGGLHLAAALLALRDGRLPATQGFESGEPEMRFAPSRVSTQGEVRHILVNSLAAGGGVVCAVFSKDLD